ncbi:ABC transporter permease [Spirosoma endophyticum]|uniref:Putative ABC transport system permease protein n=1 Tax=Spirosoma endophyticum TaxID=662367 RepID=A0A1I1VD56_9BACT|nr:ABC transporter permease [Spirosoma endophyticum]SFD81002.1 putative ABC transport system permease protein [Spirosoma endophyticum]
MLTNYLKIALRNLWKNRMFSTLTIAGMGVGIAAVGLMVLYVWHELNYDKFHTNADRVFRVVHYAQWAGGNLQLAPTSAPYADALKHEYPEIEKTVRLYPEGGGVITYRDKKIEANDIMFADKSVFDVFTFPFLYGDPASALAQPERIVLTKSLAEKLFGDAAKAVGQPVEFSNNFVNTVSGVIADVPLNSHVQFSALRSMPTNYTNGWQNFELYTYVLLTKGSDYKSLEAKLPSFYPKYLKKEMGELTYRMELQPLTAIHLHSHLDYEIGANGNSQTVYIFALVAGLILLIAGINYVNLFTVRSISRLREVGVRKAIGSRRTQLVEQFLTESMLMAFMASLVGLVLAKMALPLFNELADKPLTLTLYGPWITGAIVLLFALLLGAGSGLYPALFLSGFRTVVALKGKTDSQVGVIGFRKALVVFQFVAAVALISCSWVIYRQMGYMLHKDMGFNKEQVLTFHLESEGPRKQIQALKEELRKSPLIEAVSAASNPIGNNNIGTNGMFFEQNGVMAASTQVVQKFSVDSDYLNTLQIKLLQGRNFSESSPADAMGAVLVNEALVKKMGWQTPVGKRVNYFIGKDETAEARVVGVVRDFHTYSLQHKIEPLVLQMPAPSDKDNLYVRIRPGQTEEALAYIKKAYQQFDPAASVTFHFLDENFSRQYKAEQKQGQLLLTFTILAVLIACLGLFGLAALAAEARTKEIGVRKVLGASVASIVTLLSKDFVQLVLIAIVIASPIAWYAMGQWLQSFAYKIDLEWWVFVLAGLLAVGIAVLTISFQSVKAALMNPVKSLRSE